MIPLVSLSPLPFILTPTSQTTKPKTNTTTSNQNTKDESLQVKFLTYVLEHASRLADAQRGDGKMTWLLDFEGYALRNAPTIKTSLAVLATLQNHYPERLGAAVCYHAPSLFSVTWRVCVRGLFVFVLLRCV